MRRVLGEDVSFAWGVRQVMDDFAKRTLSYTGEEVCKAEVLSLARLAPALPPEGHGGVIPITEWVGELTRWLLEHPDACVCPDVGQELPRLQGKKSILSKRSVFPSPVSWLGEAFVCGLTSQKL